MSRHLDVLWAVRADIPDEDAISFYAHIIGTLAEQVTDEQWVYAMKAATAYVRAGRKERIGE